MIGAPHQVLQEQGLHIKQTGVNAFEVRLGDHYADHITSEEVLGIVACLVVPPGRNQIAWLRSPGEWKAWHTRLHQMAARRDEEEDTR